MYSEVFCKVYNEFGWNYYPEIFGQQLLQWLKNEKLYPKTAMDLACGTGVLCKILQENGIRADGMDFSAGMIEIAKENCPESHFDVADMINLGTISVDGAVATGQHITINAEAAVNPWTFHKGGVDQFQNRKQVYSLGVRYWPWNVYSGWWISGAAQYREYNYGGITDNKSEEGDMGGIVFGGGYSLMLGEHINLDFGLGQWTGYQKYVTYACPQCGKVVDSGEKWFVMPNNLKLGLIWIF